MKKKSIRFFVSHLAFFLLFFTAAIEVNDSTPPASGDHIALIDMNMMILPGTQAYLDQAIERATLEGASLLIVRLDTPGGMLNTTQEMIQAIFKSTVPVIVYVSPAGGTATSAGVFITQAAHIAAMAPGTSIGAAHPVSGEGKDIEGDMRAKAENMTVAMVKSISENRGRNVEWAEKSVKESSSITEKEALKLNVVDLIAKDITDLLKKINGRKVRVSDRDLVLEDLSELPRYEYDMQFRDKAMNVMANPSVAALLWLGATTGISLELYNPGAIIPGVIGVICLVLALAVMQIIPVSNLGVILIALGALMVGAEMYIGSGALAVGGIISIILGAIYFVDVGQAPDMAVNLQLFIPVLVIVAGLACWIIVSVLRSCRQQVRTGSEGMIGDVGEALTNISDSTSGSGKVRIRGEYWNAELEEGSKELIEEGSAVVVTGKKNSLTLVVKKQS